MNKGKFNTGLTAIKRAKLSGPMAWLLANGYFDGKVCLLDYGCGRGDDLRILRNVHTLYARGFDPNNPLYQDRYECRFDTVTCNFVLNTIPDHIDRIMVVADVLSHLTPTGVAWISVRNDLTKLNGWTKRGTWQGYVTPAGKLVKENNSFRLYRLDRNTEFDNLCT